MDDREGKDRPVEVESQAVEIVEDEPVSLVITDRFVKEFERSVVNYQAFMSCLFRLTNETDWVRFGDKFYLQSTGVEKLATPLQITWHAPVLRRVERTRDDERYFAYEVEGIVESGTLKRYIWACGERESIDKFFTANPPVEERDVKLAAISNWEVNAITRLLGIRNPSAAQLRAAGIDTDTIGAPEFRTQQQRAQVTEDDQRRRNELKSLCLEIAGGDEDRARDVLESLSEFQGKAGMVKGRRSTERLSGKWLKTTLERARRFQKEGTTSAD